MGVKHNIKPDKIKPLVKTYVPSGDKQVIIPVYFEGLDPSGKANGDADNKFNDLCVIYNQVDNIILDVYTCTTEPGNVYKQPSRQLSDNGWGIIAFGYYKAWKIGRHQTKSSSQYPALIQTGGEIICIRNKNPKGNRKTGKVQTGYFGCNTHTIANNDEDRIIEKHEYTYDVGSWSAMCLVHNNAELFYNEFMPHVVKAYGKEDNTRTIGQLVLPETDYINS